MDVMKTLKENESKIIQSFKKAIYTFEFEDANRQRD